MPHNDDEILERIQAGDDGLMSVLRQLVTQVMVPLPNNFTSLERTPWGGTRIVSEIKKYLNVGSPPQVVGESWEISAHPRLPSLFTFEYTQKKWIVSLPALEKLFPDLCVPCIVKLLNSGNDKIAHNLSVQVHPRADNVSESSQDRPKTEAWAILAAEPGAGIYLGIKAGVARAQFEETLRCHGDVTPYLNFVEVKAGDVFFIPSGTIHAIGAGVLLLEPQEISETTYRVYDFGRVDAHGKPRELHIEHALAATEWAGLRGEALVQSLRRFPHVISHEGTAQVELLLDESVFCLRRITLIPGADYVVRAHCGVVCNTVLQGDVAIQTNDHPRLQFVQGQSFIIPQAIQAYTIRSAAAMPVVVFELSAGAGNT